MNWWRRFHAGNGSTEVLLFAPAFVLYAHEFEVQLAATGWRLRLQNVPLGRPRFVFRQEGKEEKEDSHVQKQKGFSLIELLIVVAIILIIAAIAIPNLVRSKMSANEASAVASMRTINTSCVEYSTTYNVGFPASLANLGTSGAASSASADLIDSVLASSVKAGYVFTYTAGAADGSGSVDAYTLTAVPSVPGATGTRTFFTDQTNVIRADSTGSGATANSTPIG